jgi:hypothetical protein
LDGWIGGWLGTFGIVYLHFYIKQICGGKKQKLCGQFQNLPLIGWLKKYKIENKILLYGTVTYITALLLHIFAIHI